VTRQTWTAFVSAALFVVLAVLIAVLPVPFVAWSPGGTRDTLGAVKGQPIISVEGIPTYPTTGQLDLTIVSGTAADSRLTLMEALAAYWLPNRDTLPRDSVYPPGRSADEVQRAETQMMDSSQSDAVVAALRSAGQPVREMPVVSSVTVGGPSYQRLQPGDLVESVDGVATPSQDSVRRQIRTHQPGAKVVFAVLRNKVRRMVDVQTVASNAQPDSAVVGISVGQGYYYTPVIRFDLGQQLGGPSAGMVFALAIYDKITPGDLLGKLHVAGTGRIGPDGRVGSIGGVQQKIASADAAGATVFLVPAANCRDVAGVSTDVRLIRVATLTEAIGAIRTVAAQPPGSSLDGVTTPSC
jgi:PDZ domain-containing protein